MVIALKSVLGTFRVIVKCTISSHHSTTFHRRSATYHREPAPSPPPPPQSALRLTRDVPEDLRDPSPTRSRILREQEILRNNAQQHSSRLYATNGIQGMQ